MKMIVKTKNPEKCLQQIRNGILNLSDLFDDADFFLNDDLTKSFERLVRVANFDCEVNQERKANVGK